MIPPNNINDIIIHDIYNKVVVYLFICIILIVMICSYRYGIVDDFPVCNHFVNKNPVSICLMGGGSREIKGCKGHFSDDLDVSKLKTGDILCISYSDARSVFSSVFYASIWTHVGLVVIEPTSGEPYIVEAANYKPPYSHQILRIPLLYWLRINRNARTIGHLRINKEIPFEELDKIISSRYEEADIGVETLNLNWLRFATSNTPQTVERCSFFADENVKVEPLEKVSNEWIFKKWARKILPSYIISPESEQKQYDYLITCHEMLVDILQRVGVYESKYTPCSYIPSSIANNKIKTINGYKYCDAKSVNIKEIFKMNIS